MTRARHIGALLGALLASPLVAGAAHPVRPAGQPAPEPPPPPVDSGPEPTEDTAPAPAPTGSSRPVAPVGSTPPAAPPTAPREIPAELTAKPIEQKKIENPAEVMYRKKTETHFFRLRVRPGNPKPGDALELIVEVAELRDPPDPVQGDRVPVQNEDLVVTFGKSDRPYALHELGVPGEFGVHLTAGDSGVQTLTIRRRTSKPGLEASFPIGVGLPTPGRPDDIIASAEAKPVRMVTPPGPDAHAGDLDDLMRQLEAHAFALTLALDHPKGDLGTHAQALAELSARVPGLVPDKHTERTQEFNAVAHASTAMAEGVAHTTDREKLKAKLGDLEQNGCLRCHAQFWYGVADDTTGWPAFTPATPGAHR